MPRFTRRARDGTTRRDAMPHRRAHGYVFVRSAAHESLDSPRGSAFWHASCSFADDGLAAASCNVSARQSTTGTRIALRP